MVKVLFLQFLFVLVTIVRKQQSNLDRVNHRVVYLFVLKNNFIAIVLQHPLTEMCSVGQWPSIYVHSVNERLVQNDLGANVD